MAEIKNNYNIIHYQFNVNFIISPNRTYVFFLVPTLCVEMHTEYERDKKSKGEQVGYAFPRRAWERGKGLGNSTIEYKSRTSEQTQDIALGDIVDFLHDKLGS